MLGIHRNAFLFGGRGFATGRAHVTSQTFPAGLMDVLP